MSTTIEEHCMQLAPLPKWRQLIWPVRSHELSKFLPLFFIKLLASFIFCVLHATKDTVVVTTKGAGAEVIPVLKGGVVLIVAFMAMIVYSKLSNQVRRTTLFYTVLTPFLIFFALYGAFLFPYREAISPHTSANWLVAHIGVDHQHWVAVYRYWMNSAFFVLAELWGGMIIGLLFWGFANHVTNVKDAARFYILYTAGGHIGTTIAGILVYVMCSKNVTQNYEQIVMALMMIVVMCGAIIAWIYWHANRNLNANQHQLESKDNQKDAPTKLSLTESLKYIVTSPYLGLIAVLVIGYGVSVNMVEVVWKALLKLHFPNPTDYQRYMGVLQTILGIVAFMIALFGSTIIDRIGWLFSALLTPLTLAITSLLFFAVYFIGAHWPSDTILFQVGHIAFTPLLVLVALGTVHNVCCKAMKYCLFDPTKEMAYIPLDKEAKIKGKAAVDLVGARFGKSGSSWIQVMLIDLFGHGSILTVVPMLVPLVAVILIGWMFAVRGLGRLFQNKGTGPKGTKTKSSERAQSVDVDDEQLSPA